MAIEVRGATETDLIGWHSCLDAVAREGRWLSRLSAPPLPAFAAFVAGLRDLKAPHVVAVDGHVVGWCDIIPNQSEVRLHVGTLGIGLIASHRGKKIGHQLVALALQNARERGLERVELSVLHDNTAGLALYGRHGFIVEGRRARDWRHDGVYRDSVLMALDLRTR
jgi:RimJ/RimL family protein N-acetyltransferase